MSFVNTALAAINAGYAVWHFGLGNPGVAALSAGVAVFCGITAVLHHKRHE